ncbi:MAG: NUMOD4 domain-containing protein [Thiomicrorhabdus sp.]|nr:NUMOD4 domain-containing protein [Thiomicrorhabdus sp.]
MEVWRDIQGYASAYQVSNRGRVRLAFVGKSELDCRHLDGDPINNNLWNLKYGTASENRYDAVKHGIGVGETNGMSELKACDIPIIRKLLKTKSQQDVAIQFKVAASTVSAIHNKRTWSHVKQEDKWNY